MNVQDRLVKDGCPEGVAPVLFYGPRNANGEGSNFSDHGFWLPHPWTGELCWYRSGEHRFQALKGTCIGDHDFVNDSAATPGSVKERGRSINLRPGWGNDYSHLCWYVMFETVLAKAVQNKDVLEWLMSTGDRPIYEDSPVDDIWGWRYRNDYRGKNLLGRCWMDVRALLR